ncbi:hypothetical protein [Epibacterium ulvae]|uniref:hypothetical protein n=1 Tax=Epibacterium ulvae TaxID=1156985 RepID=UPI00248FAFA0|nr:hypothetical protein [Epibacterium ulvae]
MPNSLAYLMLMIWPLVSVVIYRRFPLERAILWCLIAGYLLLPPVAEFDLPLVPDMDKASIPSIMAFLLCVFMMKKSVPLRPRHPVAVVLMLLFLVSVIPTVITNRDPLIFQVLAGSDPIVFITDMIPGMKMRDLGSVMINQVILMLPFLLARRYLSSTEAQKELILTLVTASLLYSLLGLVEVRLSPQVNTWVYGFFQHDFSQTIRQGGYRPLVFLEHPLWYALFIVYGLLCATALLREASGTERTRKGMVFAYLLVFLYLCKSLAAQLYAICFIPVLLWAPLRWQLRLALLLGAIAVIYPMLRNLDMIPTDAIVAYAESYSADRAQSLGYRFDNEELMLSRAAEKPIFGWGEWGRNLVRDPETAFIVSVPDGRWIIVFGSFGWLGYIAEMGLLTFPLLLLWQQVRRHDPTTLSPYLGAIVLILAATLIDMLLNATLIPLTWLCAGSILGYAEHLKYPDLFQKRRALFDGKQAIGLPKAADQPRSLM